MPPTSSQKIRSIEGLRGVLALWVLLSHALAAAGLGEHWRGPFEIITNGEDAVAAFIIISGFVIFYLLDTAKENYRQFLWRRLLRLYPVYIICLLISASLLPYEIVAYSNPPWPHYQAVNRVIIAKHSLEFFPEQLLVHLGMLQSLVPDWLLPNSNYAILGQAWSLSLEWQFYLLAPLVLAAIAAGPRPAIAAIAIACAAHFLFAGNEGFLPRHIPMFALGIASFYLWRLPWRPQSPLLGPAVVALAYLLTYNPGVVIWSAVFMAAYQRNAIGAAVVTRILEWRVNLFLGRISYSIYLSHAIILTILLVAFKEFNLSRIGQWPFFFVLLAATLAGTLAASATLYRFVERPFIALGKRRVHGKLMSPGLP